MYVPDTHQEVDICGVSVCGYLPLDVCVWHGYLLLDVYLARTFIDIHRHEI